MYIVYPNTMVTGCDIYHITPTSFFHIRTRYIIFIINRKHGCHVLYRHYLDDLEPEATKC